MTNASASSQNQSRHAANLRPLLPDESANGYVARQAAAVFAPRMSDLTCAATRCSPQHAAPLVMSAAAGAKLASSLGVDPSDFGDRIMRDAEDPGRVRLFGSSIDRRHIVATTRRFGPKALMASAHHRALWMLTAFPFCTETWQLLADTCANPHCRATQRWVMTVGIDLCDNCGEPLHKVSREKVLRPLRANLEAAVGLFGPDPERQSSSRSRLPTELQVVSNGGILDLLCATAGVIDPEIRSPAARQLISASATAYRVAAAVAEAWTILEGWPQAFEDFASKRLGARAGRHGDGNAGATTSFLLLPTRCKMERGAMAAIDKMRERFTTNNQRGYGPAKAAAICGLHLSTLNAARRDGRVPTIFYLDCRRAVALLDRVAVDASRGASRVYYNSAAATLGITHRAVEELVVLKLLSVAPAELRSREMRAVTKSSLQNLIDRIRGAASNIPIEGAISLHAAMRGVAGLKPWAAAIKAMIDGSIRFNLPADQACLIREVLVPDSAWQTLRTIAANTKIDDAGFAPNMSKFDAADALSLMPRHYSTALKGWPTSFNEYTVPVIDVVEIARTTIPAAEIALRLGVGSKAVRQLMAADGVERVSEAGYDRAQFEGVFGTGSQT